MTSNVTPDVCARILTLRDRDKLTVAVIAQRLGLGQRTIQRYLAQLRAAGRTGAPVRHGIYRET